MSDLNPSGEKVTIGGQERNLLFTLNVIDALQEKCNEPVFDTLKKVLDMVEGKIEHENIEALKSTLTVLINNTLPEAEHVTDKEVGDMVTSRDYMKVATYTIRAWGFSLPDPDEEDEEDDESPKAETEQ